MNKLLYAFLLFLCLDVFGESIFSDCSEFVKQRELAPIEHEGITVAWVDNSSEVLIDLREESIPGLLKIDMEKIFDRLGSNGWVLVTADNFKCKGARGLNREWQGGDDNIGVNIFIPTSFVGGNRKYLDLLMHRAIPIAIFRVFQAKLLKYCPEKASKIKLKWINDVIIDEKKICGIKPDDFVKSPKFVSYLFAINLNMPQEQLDKIDQPATSLAVECGRNFDRLETIKEIITELISVLKEYQKDLKKLDRYFSSQMAFLGEEVIVYDAAPGENIEGILEYAERGDIFIRTYDGRLVGIRPGYGILRKKYPN